MSDADFYQTDVSSPIRIVVTIASLDDRLRNLDTYGLYLRGFDPATGEIEDEPGASLMDVLSIQFMVSDDLDPRWALISDRATAQGLSLDLTWRDRLSIAPTRIGGFSAHNLSWRPGSILTSISDERSNVSQALANTSRQARHQFGTTAAPDLAESLSAVKETAIQLGIEGATNPTAMLDAQSVAPTDGSISLHDATGVPLRNLGLGSARLLIAGLQSRTAANSTIVLVDEVEHGLEPHRIARFLVALGAKAQTPASQVFITTHSPVVLRELAADQIHIVRDEDNHKMLWAGDQRQGLQGSLRRYAEAFLGTSVLVCEGATEVGLVRGIDLYRDGQGMPTFMASGGALVDAGGIDKIYGIAESFCRLGYRTAVLRDDDKTPDLHAESQFQSFGGRVFKWSDGFAFEDELFASVTSETAVGLCHFALTVHGRGQILEHLRNAVNGTVDLDSFLTSYSIASAPLLAKAAKRGKWFKRISIMENAAREIVGPALAGSEQNLQVPLDSIFQWGIHGGR